MEANQDGLRKIFISHAAADRRLLERFVCLLRLGLGLGTDGYFASSLPESAVPFGTEIITAIQTELVEASFVVALYTPNYRASPFCWCEAGGTWAKELPFAVLVAPSQDFGDLDAVLAGRIAGRLDNSSDLDRLCDDICGATARHANMAMWNSAKADFLAELPEVLQELPPPAGPPSRRPQPADAGPGEARLTEMFMRAIDQLGSTVQSVRVGGILALGRIATESDLVWWPVMSVLTSHLRGCERPVSAEAPRRIPEECQAILNVIGQSMRPSRWRDPLDLRQADLAGCRIRGGGWRWVQGRAGGDPYKRAGVDFFSANLQRSGLRGADMTGASFRQADLRQANFDGAVLEYANLEGAKLHGAVLTNVRLAHGKLNGASLCGATLDGADLAGADVTADQLAETQGTPSRLPGASGP